MGRGNYEGRGNFEEENGNPLQSIGTLCGQLCKNNGTDRYAIWVVSSGGLKEPSIRC